MRLAIIVFLSAVIIDVNAAEITPPHVNGCMIQIDGELVASDVENLRNALAAPGCVRTSPHIHLSSPGGDVNAAMQMGRMLRKRNANTYIGDVCVSACNLIFLAGTHRFAWGRFGVHRPYPTELTATYDSAKAAQDSMGKSIRAYFQEMAIDGRLADLMVNTPPERVRWLTNQELEDFNVHGADAATADLEASEEAKRLGISKATYFERLSMSDVLCPPVFAGEFQGRPVRRMSAQLRCHEAVMSTGRRPKN